MKKLFLSFLFAVSAAGIVPVFAQENADQIDLRTPTPTELYRRFNTTDNVVLCVRFWGDVCNDIVVVGNYNDWDVSDVSALVRMNPLEGYTNWYVAELPFAPGLRIKPVQLDNDGTLNWNFQTGGIGDWTFAGAQAAALELNDYEGECNLFVQAPGVYIYEAAWKNNCTPCDIDKPGRVEMTIFGILALFIIIGLVCGRAAAKKQSAHALLSIVGGIAAALVILGIMFKVLHWSGATMLLLIAMAVLLFFCFAGIAGSPHCSQDAKPACNILRYIGIALFLALAVLAIGVVFKTFHWPGASLLLLCSGCALALLAILAGIFCAKVHKDK